MVDMYKLINSVKLKPVSKTPPADVSAAEADRTEAIDVFLNKAIMRVHDSLNPADGDDSNDVDEFEDSNDFDD